MPWVGAVVRVRGGTVSRRFAEAPGGRNVVAVALVVENTPVPSRPRGFARTPSASLKTSREPAKSRGNQTG